MEHDMLDPRAEPSHPRATFSPRALSSHTLQSFSLFNTYFSMKIICLLQRASQSLGLCGSLDGIPLVNFSCWTQVFLRGFSL